mgnify:CR=1 FL=1
MTDISVNGLVKSFELGKNILDGLSFDIAEGERVGILGHNGCGKTTLFRILTGEIDYDEGAVAIASGKRLGLISQIPVYPDGWTTEDVLKDAHRELYAISARLDELAHEMEHDQSDKLLAEYDRLSADFSRLGGYDMDTDRNRVANGLDIPQSMREQPFDLLSGGERTRVNLARLILEKTDILLLDEPTHHLDLRATEWLEDYLQHFKGTVLLISHDRYFIDKIAQRCIEISDGKAEFYSGGYSFYVVERQKRFEEKLRKYEKDQAKIEQLTRAAEQMHLWAFMGNDKLHKRAFSMEKRIAKLEQTAKPTEAKKLSAKFSSSDFYGDEVLVCHNVSKAFGERKLFEGLELNVSGGERIALIGDNGTGKSTLVKMIMQQETPDEGYIKFGPSVRPAYLPQIIHFSNEERSLLDTMLYDCRCQPQEARDRLAAFGFRGEDVFTPVGALSGGEKSRLRLCLLMGSGNGSPWRVFSPIPAIFSSWTSPQTIWISQAASGWRMPFRIIPRRCCSFHTTDILSKNLQHAYGTLTAESCSTTEERTSRCESISSVRRFSRARQRPRPRPQSRISLRRNPRPIRKSA